MTKRQITFIIASTMLAMSSGCRTIDYTSPRGERIRYMCAGPQRLESVQIELPGGPILMFDKQDADINGTIDALTSFLQELKTLP